MGEWKYGICSVGNCFSDWKLCLITFCNPFHTWGVTTEMLAGEKGDTTRCLTISAIPLVNMIFFACWRKFVREKNDIEGNFVFDCCAISLCCFCSILQAGHEAGMSGDFECSRTCELISKGLHGFDPKAEISKAKTSAAAARSSGGPNESSHLTEGMGRQ